jgi:hypothetical protein
VPWQRILIVFVAMTAAGLVTHIISERLGVQIHVRSGAAYFAMAMAAWIVARDYIQQNLLMGKSFGTWFLGTLVTAIVVNVLIWYFWPQ